MNSWSLNPTPKRRDKLYIIAEILEIAEEGTLKTQIMYRANLSFTQLNHYLRFMVKLNLLDKIYEDGKEIYKTTEKGMNFLRRYRELTELLKMENTNAYKNDVKLPPPNLLKQK